MASKRFDSDEITSSEALPGDVTKAEAEKRPVEKWAAAKGYLPQVLPSRDMALPPGAPTAGTVAVNMSAVTGPRHNPEYWRFAAAKAMHGWPESWELTEAQFDEAVKAATTATAR